MLNNTLTIARIVHELVGKVIPAAPRNVLNPSQEISRRGVRGPVVGAAPVSGVEREPGLVAGFQAQSVATATVTRVTDAGGDWLQC